MNRVYKFTYFILIIQVVTQNVLTENVASSDSNDDLKSKDGRRSGGIIILDNSGKPSDGQRITSHKVETKTYTTRVSSGGGGSGGVQEWVSGSHVEPKIQRIVQNQDPCVLKNHILPNSGGQDSIVQKKSTVHSSQTINSGGSFDSLTANQNPYQSGQKGVRMEPLVMGQLGGPALLHGSQVNNLNDVTSTIVRGNQEINTVHEEIDNFHNQDNVFYPDNDSYKVSLSSSGDGIYANEPVGQQLHNAEKIQNLNVMLHSESNSPNIVAVPVVNPQLGHYTVQGYRPNMQYYLRQIEASNMLKNPSVMNVPSFMQQIKPDQVNVNLSEEQLNSYKQYLIQTGLIKLKPYQLIFSDQFRPMLRTLQWMVVPLESNAEYCKQRCGNLFARNTLYSTITENASRLPLKLLVPILKIHNGLRKTANGIQTMAGGVGDIPPVFRMSKDASTHPSGPNSKISS